MPSNRGTLFGLPTLATSSECRPYILAARETTLTAIPGQGFSVTGTAGPGAPGINLFQRTGSRTEQ